jgi:hypothetical protein
MHKVFEIFFDDFKEEVQKELLNFYEIKEAAEGNLDVIPLAFLEVETGEKLGVEEDLNDNN